ncbi:uncharacterized protein HD556DRAFT_1446377 [Suillus plorans]|uniref:DNA 3'-5' helicase n=1 Tax=Suillus plorans TaxID=116603 RepID=A0A9P7AJP2_9AGAM|nr:uncharacterized protein HD556DRAFT_1446377 [Suillus plorans]KAG1790241.1 hypothetical protein HD556DRAFT_1446377 [Suillus plorans]
MDTSTIIRAVREASLQGLYSFARSLIQERLPNEYIEALGDKDRMDALRACLLVYVLTATTIVPRQFQLEAILTTLNGRDSGITADSMYKESKLTYFGDRQSIRDGRFNHLIVLPEQLFMFNGHLPRLAQLIRKDSIFIKRIKRVHIDEAHNIYTAGLPHHGEEAFRPSFSKLGELRVLLAKDTIYQALSATLPPHILSVIKWELSVPSNHLSLTLSTNRPNIVYAITPLIGGTRNFHNFDCLIPPNYTTPMIIPKTLIFHDNKQEAVDAAAYNNSHLPKALQNRGVVKYYHSDMSAEYLQQTYEDFASDSGSCRILHATAGTSTVISRIPDLHPTIFPRLIRTFGHPIHVSSPLSIRIPAHISTRLIRTSGLVRSDPIRSDPIRSDPIYDKLPNSFLCI